MQSQKGEEVSQNKENIDEFRKFIRQQKPTNTKIKTQSDMKTWKRFCLTENSSKVKFFGHIINPLLNKLVRSRWLDIGLVLFIFAFSWTSTLSRSIITQKILTSRLLNNAYEQSSRLVLMEAQFK